MDFEAEESDQYAFVSSLVEAVPELQPIWDTFESEWGEFLSTTLMYDLARGMVALAQDVRESGSGPSAAALARAYARIEEGLAEPPPSPIPALIRTTWGDWLGRQSAEPALYEALCESMGASMRRALRPMEEAKTTKAEPSTTSTLPWAEPSSEALELECLYSAEWSYSLWRIRGTTRLFLSVLCGSVGIYEVTIALNPGEVAELRRGGRGAVERWARAITERPKSVLSRQVKLPKTWVRSARNPGLWESMERTEADYRAWAEKSGVVFEDEALPEEIDASAWGWRMKNERPYQLWVVMKSDPLDLASLEARIEALSLWSSRVHKERAGWTSFLQKPLRLCLVVLTSRIQKEQRDWVWGVGYFQRRRALVRHLFLVDHVTGQVCRQQNVSKVEKTASLQGGMEAVHQNLERYMRGRLSAEGPAGDA